MSNTNSGAYLMFLATQSILKKEKIRLNCKALEMCMLLLQVAFKTLMH